MQKTESWPATIVAILSALAIFEWPYGYYQFLRLAILAVSIYYLYSARQQHVQILAQWAMIGFALLFNPVVPVHLDRSTWAIFNLLCAGYFFWVGKNIKAGNIIKSNP